MTDSCSCCRSGRGRLTHVYLDDGPSGISTSSFTSHAEMELTSVGTETELKSKDSSTPIIRHKNEIELRERESEVELKKVETEAKLTRKATDVNIKQTHYELEQNGSTGMMVNTQYAERGEGHTRTDRRVEDLSGVTRSDAEHPRTPEQCVTIRMTTFSESES